MPREESPLESKSENSEGKKSKEEAENEKWREKGEKRNDRHRVEGNFINNSSNEMGSHREKYVLVIIPNGAAEIKIGLIGNNNYL